MIDEALMLGMGGKQFKFIGAGSRGVVSNATNALIAAPALHPDTRPGDFLVAFIFGNPSFTDSGSFPGGNGWSILVPSFTQTSQRGAVYTSIVPPDGNVGAIRLTTGSGSGGFTLLIATLRAAVTDTTGGNPPKTGISSSSGNLTATLGNYAVAGGFYFIAMGSAYNTSSTPTVTHQTPAGYTLLQTVFATNTNGEYLGTGSLYMREVPPGTVPSTAINVTKTGSSQGTVVFGAAAKKG